MLDMGFYEDIIKIISYMPKQRQNLMFSATFSGEIKKLSEEFLNAPQLIEVARSNAAADNVTQKVYRVAADQKPELLSHLLREENPGQAIVFTKTKLAASRLARKLQLDGLAADAIHGDKSQRERMEAQEAFKQGKVTTLVATDVAARGLDIDQLPMVINFELPSAPEDYVHRIGRTGRAGASGTAISLVAPEEEKYLKEIEKLIKREIVKQDADMPAGRAPRQRHASPSPAAQSHVANPRKKSGDDWFSRPYVPSSTATAQPQPRRTSLKPKREIAALLGGLLRRSE